MAEKKGVLAEFKEFLLRGNMIDLAIAFILALAFSAIIKDIVDLLTNLLAIAGHTSFADLEFHEGGGVFKYGQLIQDIITFVIVAAVLFFVVVRPYNYLLDRRKRGEEDPESTERPCPECLSSIPKAASRCAFCTAEVTPEAQVPA